MPLTMPLTIALDRIAAYSDDVNLLLDMIVALAEDEGP